MSDMRHATRNTSQACWFKSGWLRVACCVLLVAVCGCKSAGLTPDWHRVDPPTAAPDFSLTQLDGQPAKLSEYRGRVVIMEFWATWCGPCRYAMPSLDAIYRRFRDRGVTVLLINQGESAQQIRAWARRRVKAPILLDREQAVSRRYGLRGLPQLFVIDQQGQIAFAHGGYGGGLEMNLTLILNELLKAQQAPSDA